MRQDKRNLVTTRRDAVIGAVAVGVAVAMAPKFSAAQTFPKPKTPLVINVIDVAGDLQLSQAALQKFADTHRDLVSKFVLRKGRRPNSLASSRPSRTPGGLTSILC